MLDRVNKISIPGMETCYKINPRYSLDFVENIKPEEKKLILLAFKSFKTREKNQEISFLSQRDLFIVTEFFSLYGESLRNVDHIGCDRIDGLFCICFIEDCTSTDITNLQQSISILKGDLNRKETFTLMRDRDLKIFAEFFLKYHQYFKGSDV